MFCSYLPPTDILLRTVPDFRESLDSPRRPEPKWTLLSSRKLLVGFLLLGGRWFSVTKVTLVGIQPNQGGHILRDSDGTIRSLWVSGRSCGTLRRELCGVVRLLNLA